MALGVWETFSSRRCHIFPIKAVTGCLFTLRAGKLSGLEALRKQTVKKCKIPKFMGFWPQLELFQQCLNVLLLTDSTAGQEGNTASAWGLFRQTQRDQGSVLGRDRASSEPQTPSLVSPWSCCAAAQQFQPGVSLLIKCVAEQGFHTKKKTIFWYILGF